MHTLFYITTLLIIYGSLYPFDFQLPDAGGLLDNLLLQAPFNSKSTLSNLVANIVLFVPFGLFGTISHVKKGRHLTHLLRLVLFGTLLAYLLQLLQIYLPSRYPHWHDVAFNVIGIGIGSLIALTPAASPFQGNIRTERLLSPPWLLLLSWLASQLIPFVPSIEVDMLRDNVKLLLDPAAFSLATASIKSVYWLAFAAILHHLVGPQRFRRLFLLTLAGTFMLKLFLVDSSLTGADLLAGTLACFASPYLLRTFRYRTRSLLSLALLAAITLNGILPFQLGPVINSFNWLPFHGFLSGNMLINSQALTEKFFLYGSLIWLLKQAGSRLFIATLLVAVWSLMIEVFQVFIQDHTPEITDPIFILIIGLAIHLLENRKRIPDEGTFPSQDQQQPPRETEKASGSNASLIVKEVISPVLLGTLFITLAIKTALSLPGIPYNAKELFLDHGSLPAILFFSVALLWLGMGTVYSARAGHNSRYPYLVVPLSALITGLIFLFLLKRGVTYESLSDLVGSPYYRRHLTEFTTPAIISKLVSMFPDMTDTVERYVRFSALTFPLVGFISLWTYLLTTGKSTSIQRYRNTALILVFLLPLLMLSKSIVLDYPATDNITELIAENGAMPLLLLLVLLAANIALMVSANGRRRYLTAIAFTIVALPVSWLLLNSGLADEIHKYRQTFSGVDFLLGPDRQHKLPTAQLVARWAGVYIGLLSMLVFGGRIMQSASSRVWLIKPAISGRLRGHQGKIAFVGMAAALLFSLTLLIDQSSDGTGYRDMPTPKEQRHVLPLPAGLIPGTLANFRLAHPRLPSPSADEIDTIEQHNPAYLKQIKSQAGQKGKFHQQILMAYIDGHSPMIGRLFDDLMQLEFEGRGNTQVAPLAVAYDWLYDQWSPRQRQQLQNKLAAGCDYLIDYIRKKERLSPYNVILYNSPLQALMAAAISLYRDHTAGERCMAFTYDYWTNRVLPVWRQVMGINGGWHEGGEYVGIGIGKAIYQLPAMWRRATGEDLFAAEPGIRGFLDFLIHRTRPDGTHMRWGDAAFFDRTVSDRIPLAIEYSDSAAYSLGGCPRPFQPSTWPWGPLTTDSLCYREAIKKRPRQRLFDGIGMLIARSDWGQDATYLTFKAGDNYWSHSHLDQGAFTLFKGGPLAIDSGLYGPKYGSEHHMNYSYQAIAHNTITVTDPADDIPIPPKEKDRIPRTIANDGGQRRIGSGWGIESAPLDLDEWLAKREIYHTGKIEQYLAQDDLVVAVADITAAYTNKYSGKGMFSHRTRRVEKYWRTLIYDRQNDIVIVFDDITASDPSFKKRALIHTMEQPMRTLSGFRTRVSETRSPARTGGRLKATILLPENPEVRIIGGKGAEFMADGINYDEGGKIWQIVERRRKNPPEPGRWRVEISPPTEHMRDRFLMVLEPGIEGKPRPSPRIERLKDDTGDGCKIIGRTRTMKLHFPADAEGVIIELVDTTGDKTLDLTISGTATFARSQPEQGVWQRMKGMLGD